MGKTPGLTIFALGRPAQCRHGHGLAKQGLCPIFDTGAAADQRRGGREEPGRQLMHDAAFGRDRLDRVGRLVQDMTIFDKGVVSITEAPRPQQKQLA